MGVLVTRALDNLLLRLIHRALGVPPARIALMRELIQTED